MGEAVTNGPLLHRQHPCRIRRRVVALAAVAISAWSNGLGHAKHRFLTGVESQFCSIMLLRALAAASMATCEGCLTWRVTPTILTGCSWV